jgi:hypothetical protein
MDSQTTRQAEANRTIHLRAEFALMPLTSGQDARAVLFAQRLRAGTMAL